MLTALFRKDIEPRCAYCAKGSMINDREVICSRKGVVAMEYHRGHFAGGWPFVCLWRGGHLPQGRCIGWL